MANFEISETQRHVAASAAEFAREVLGPAETELDRLANPEEVFASETFWKCLAQAFELGFHKMAIPEAFGGLGLDNPTVGMVWEEIGRWAPGFAATLIPGGVAPQLICFLAPNRTDLISRFVTPYCEDTTARSITAWCSSEPEVGSDGSNYFDPSVHHHTMARKCDDSFKLNGAKSDFVSNGSIASAYIVFACTDPSLGIRGSGTFIIAGDTKGLKRGKALDKTGLRVLNQAPIFFDDVQVPADQLIFPCGDLYPTLHNSIITVGNLAVGYLAVGIMRGAYEYALEHAQRRVQWGKPIREHQLVAEKLFKCFTAIETARAFLWKGSWLCKEKFPGDLKTSLAAKIYATEQAVIQTAEMVQVLGGYGISREYPVEKFARDAKLLRIMDGTNETLLIKAASHL
jgi:alkylation response protein AidB-like acyl-CoA dehydrogenase